MYKCFNALTAGAAVFVIAVLLYLLAPSTADGHEVGDTIEVLGYCVGRDDARRLADAVHLRGQQGYTEVLQDVNVKCYDTRVHSPTGGAYFVAVELTERAWRVRLPDGTTYQFWRARDVSTEDGYVWTLVLGEEEQT